MLLDDVLAQLGVRDRDNAGPWSYQGKLCLAPMVRVGTLPMRILSRQYGADIVYTDEIIDRKVVRTSRVVNPETGLIEYELASSKNTSNGYGRAQPVFATYQDEPVVFQIGTSDPCRALAAAEHVARDVKAIDINMGCPRPFSISGGMGSALLSQPDLVYDIVSTLRRNISIPITCKIRLLRDPKQTLELCRRIESAGASAIAIHARYSTDRDRYRCLPDGIPEIVSSLDIPVIFNGDIFAYDQIQGVLEQTSAAAVMIARGAQWNPSVFSPGGPVPVWDVLSQYLALSRAVRNTVNNTKYTMMKMKANHCRLKGDMTFVKAKTFEDLEGDMEILRCDMGMTGVYKPPCILMEREADCGHSEGGGQQPPISASKKRSFSIMESR